MILLPAMRQLSQMHHRGLCIRALQQVMATAIIVTTFVWETRLDEQAHTQKLIMDNRLTILRHLDGFLDTPRAYDDELGFFKN